MQVCASYMQDLDNVLAHQAALPHFAGLAAVRNSVPCALASTQTGLPQQNSALAAAVVPPPTHPLPPPCCPPAPQTGLALNIDMAATAMLEMGELTDYM